MTESVSMAWATDYPPGSRAQIVGCGATSPDPMGSVDRAGIDRLDRGCLVAGGLHRQDDSLFWMHGTGQGGGCLGCRPIDALTDQPADRDRGGQVRYWLVRPRGGVIAGATRRERSPSPRHHGSGPSSGSTRSCGLMSTWPAWAGPGLHSN